MFEGHTLVVAQSSASSIAGVFIRDKTVKQRLADLMGR